MVEILFWKTYIVFASGREEVSAAFPLGCHLPRSVKRNVISFHKADPYGDLFGWVYLALPRMPLWNLYNDGSGACQPIACKFALQRISGEEKFEETADWIPLFRFLFFTNVFLVCMEVSRGRSKD